MFVFGVILVRIFLAFSRIRTEYGDGVSLRIQSECGKMREKCGPEQLRIRTLFTQCLHDNSFSKTVFLISVLWVNDLLMTKTN